MKTPDKIFVPVVYLGQEEGDCPSPIWWEKDKSHEHEEVIGSIIYIRKDALLAWAEEWAERYPYSHEFQMIINKLNSM